VRILSNIQWFLSMDEENSTLKIGIGLAAVAAISFLLYATHKKFEEQEVQCLALNVYHEARGESVEGQRAVAIVTMNRVRSQHYPDTVCAVVYDEQYDSRYNRYVAAFSWTNDFLPDQPNDIEAWKRAFEIAKHEYQANANPIRLTHAMHYHSVEVNPDWAPEKKLVARIGNHKYYE